MIIRIIAAGVGSIINMSIDATNAMATLATNRTRYQFSLGGGHSTPINLHHSSSVICFLMLCIPTYHDPHLYATQMSQVCYSSYSYNITLALIMPMHDDALNMEDVWTH